MRIFISKYISKYISKFFIQYKHVTKFINLIKIFFNSKKVNFNIKLSVGNLSQINKYKNIRESGNWCEFVLIYLLHFSLKHFLQRNYFCKLMFNKLYKNTHVMHLVKYKSLIKRYILYFFLNVSWGSLWRHDFCCCCCSCLLVCLSFP